MNDFSLFSSSIWHSQLTLQQINSIQSHSPTHSIDLWELIDIITVIGRYKDSMHVVTIFNSMTSIFTLSSTKSKEWNSINLLICWVLAACWLIWKVNEAERRQINEGWVDCRNLSLRNGKPSSPAARQANNSFNSIPATQRNWMDVLAELSFVWLCCLPAAWPAAQTINQFKNWLEFDGWLWLQRSRQQESQTNLSFLLKTNESFFNWNWINFSLWWVGWAQPLTHLPI